MESELLLLFRDHQLTLWNPQRSSSLEQGKRLTVFTQEFTTKFCYLVPLHCLIYRDTSELLLGFFFFYLKKETYFDANISFLMKLVTFLMKDPIFHYYTPPCLIKVLFKSDVPNLNIGATWGWEGAQTLALNLRGTIPVLQLTLTVIPGEALHMSAVTVMLPVNVRKGGICHTGCRLSAQ